ncbi:hypothetical protein EMIHUDRAFT_429157, partial [Emiliania huxleyi CCMP1516]|uniref:Helicase ATP-binding domain-containing protein n=2 Tax=Emiliania huxleyi TaxID=2903 RepID=A0A0D3KLC2_EMIH1
MRDYQLEGLNWMISLHARGLNGILADEMGLGKTLQSISLLGYLSIVEREPAPHLVVVPLTVLGNWCKEIERWCPGLRAVRLHGNKDERRSIIETQVAAGNFHVLVTTYECVASEATALRKLRWRFLVVDEAHRLKNEESKLSVILRSIKVTNRLLLTGTPIQNNLHELWALLNFLFPDIFNTSEPFDRSFDSKAGHVSVSSLDRLQRLLQ